MNRTLFAFAGLLTILSGGRLELQQAAAQTYTRQASASNYLSAADKQNTETVLRQLANYERQLLSGGRTVGGEDSRGTSAYGSPGAVENARKIGEAQQEALVSEILRLRRRLKVLENQKQTTTPDPAAEREAASLKLELDRERQRVLSFEKEINRLKEDQHQQTEQLRAKKGSDNDAYSERLRAEKAAKELKELQARYEQVKAEAAKGSAFREKLVSTARTAEQLEVELQAKKALETDNQYLRAESERLKAENGKLEAELQRVRRTAAEADRLGADYQKTLAAKDGEILETKRQLSKTIEEVRACQTKAGGQDQLYVQLTSANEQIAALRQQVADKDKESQSCAAELAGSKQMLSRMGDLRKDLVAAKNELLLKDAEAQLFGEKKEKADRRPRPGAPNAARAALNADPAAVLQAAAPAAAPAAKPVVPNDVMTVEVTEAKVHLRSGPGEENSPLMAVARGTRLVVEAREGDWLRVIAPTGGRAYILNNFVRTLTNGSGQNAPATATAAAGIQPDSGGPRKPPVRVGQEAQPALEPFGDVPRSGRGDAEALALERARNMGTAPAAIVPE